MLDQDGFNDRLVFSNEATFLLTDKVNKHNSVIWGTEYSHLTLENVRDSPKVNVFCAISKKRVYRSLFFEGRTVNSEAHLAMLQNWLMKLLKESKQTLFFYRMGHHLSGVSL